MMNYSLILSIFISLFLITISDAIRVLPHDETRRSSERYDEPHRQLYERLLTNTNVASSPDEHLVTDLPLLDSALFPTKHWAGLLPASAHDDKYFFYWLFAPAPSENRADTDIPLLIWLNGGPACSSMDGLFIENGPFRFVVDPQTKEYKLVPDDDYSWHKLPAYTLYIDQPVGTGLSFTTSRKYPTNDIELCTDFYFFLQTFLKLHADKFVDNDVMNRDLFFSGESYAGHYNVIYTNHILQQNNEKLGKGDVRIRIQGAAIGNGWVDPYHQYAGADAAYGHGLIGMSEVAAFGEKEIQCQRMLDQGSYNTGICFDLVDEIVSQSFGKGSNYKISSYDIRRVEGPGMAQFPPGHTIIEGYLGHWGLDSAEEGTLPDDITTRAIQALHAEASVASGQRYKECTDPPYLALAKLDGKGVVPEIVQILEHPDKVELLFFNGIQDMVCNHVGNERSLEKLPWKHTDDWNKAPRYAWSGKASGPTQVSGYMREYQNLKYLKILDAGHMVPLDVPAVAFEMMQNFLYGGSFQISQQVLDRTKPSECAVCPQCPVDHDSGTTTTTSGTVHPLFFLLPGMILIILVCAASRYWERKQTVVERVSIPQHHGLELQESRYTDEPDENGAPTGVI